MTNDQKVDLKSLNIVEKKIEELKKSFPEVITEGKIDFEKLRLILGDKIEVGKERYDMNWPGKADCFKTIQTPSIATLKPDKEKSVDFDTTENLFIEGDNLEVLKLLQKSYFGKIKMIYIDPPYNTGNDFVYPDDYSESLDTYLRYTGQKNRDGKHFSTNVETNGRFHSKWMNMMYPRLFLARNLLKDDGVIFISIDDNEVENLKKICNEIFGEENFAECLVWKRRATPPNDRIIGCNHEYILVFAKNSQVIKLELQPRSEEDKKAYINPDNDPRGPYRISDLSGSNKGGRGTESCVFPIEDPNGKTHNPPPNKRWLYNKEKVELYIKEGRIGFRKESGTPFLKRYLSEVRDGVTLPTLITDAGTSQDSSIEIRKLFGVDVYEFPKPTLLLKKLIYCGASKDDIVLDFFAGSATTAHSILELNIEDNGNRKFIMVQLPEPTDENSEAFKAGYKNITQIGEERIRKVIKNIKDEQNGKLDFDDKKLDLGFKVFKLESSNFKIWDGTKKENLAEQLEAFVNHINPKSSQDDILYELILKSGFSLTAKIETLELAGKKVYSISEGTLYICLEKEITKELLQDVANRKPIKLICLDEGFQNNDQLKTNAVEIMKAKGVEFRTV